MIPRRAHHVFIPALLVAVLVAAVYAPARQFNFINYDDPRYVVYEPHVRAGLGLSTIVWAFGRTQDNWHPLTSLSHAAVWQVWGDAPAAHHLVNVVLHAANAGLVVGALSALTGNPLRAAVVATLFALHPLRVESVAWVTERKDVLSGLGFLVTLWAYAAWVRRPSPWRRVAVLIAFVGALLAKPMVVTLPVVLLVLDWWPLRRDGPLLRLVREKLSLFALAAAASVATVVAQRTGGAMATLEVVPLSSRLANAVVANARYLGMTLWPAHLAYFYPYRRWAPATIAAAAVLLVAVSGAAFVLRRRHPYLAAGWAWWLVMLLPVSGIIQVGEQSIADRYTYLPSIGLLLAVVWLVADLARTPAQRAVAVGAAALAVAASAWATSRQLPAWRDSETVARHAVAAVAGNYIGHLNLGQELAARGEYADAKRQYEAAIRIKPDSAPVLVNLGRAALRDEQLDDANAWFRRALAAHADYPMALDGLGRVLAARGDPAAAIPWYERAVAAMPELADARADLAEALAKVGRVDEAVREYAVIVAAHPTLGFELGNLLFQQGDPAGAIEAWRGALAVNPEWHDARDNVAVALITLERPAEAIVELERIVRDDPRHARAQLHLGFALASVGRRDEAVSALRTALSLRPEDPDAANALADLLGGAQ